MIRSIFSGNSVCCQHVEDFKASTASADNINEHIWYINRVFVNKDHRRRGIGTQMVIKLKEELRVRDPEAVLLVTPGGYDMPLKQQKAFYKSLGFKDSTYGGNPCLKLKV